MNEANYSLGHDDPEIQRLLLQGRLYAGHTAHALRLAGLAPGMRVLDVGCGPGDVSISAARIVGPTGSVVGVDAQQSILDIATARAADKGVNATFFRGDIFALDTEEPFDAVTGRLILMHLPDPAAAVRHLSTLVRPGGIVTFQDFEISAVATVPEPPLFQRLVELIVHCFHAAGANTEMGTSLHRTFRAAGLPAPEMTMGGCVSAATDPEVVQYLVGVWRSLKPVADQLGLDVDDVSDLDDLPERLRASADPDAVVVLPPLISAWSVVPGA
ncbi:methyltransferase domain-containing protein [Saccharopolyspora flava]|uniref:Methyltransferase domain-containing protein n=1 Tax=Saccharopolyspora flava TaxID=95161 RepID=A0A1I6TAZ2_9PSEU|nr:methyltransferase domain-containing protein [Saccharopolyspora flava]SFS86384.1 Methyltransferase domain-containing protein [Saccharopolyspora flava]